MIDLAVPEYNLVPLGSNEYRLEWEPYHLEDTFERWAILYIDTEAGLLSCDFEYEKFMFRFDFPSETFFKNFFDLRFQDIHSFIKPLNKRLVYDVEASLESWGNILYTKYVMEDLTQEEYKRILDFFNQECSTEKPVVVIENLIMGNPLLTSLFINPGQVFKVELNYPFCTRFFLTYIFPILVDAYDTNKI